MRKTKKRKTGFGMMAILVFSICSVVLIRGVSLGEESDTYKEQISNLQKQIEAEDEREEEIVKQKSYMKTRQYIEEVAREKLGLVYEDEILVKPENK